MIKTTIPKKTMLSCTRRKSLKETIYLKKKEMQRRNMGDVIKVTLTIYNLLNVSLDKYTNVCLKCFVFLQLVLCISYVSSKDFFCN